LRGLAVTITRSGFECALAHACLSHYEPKLFPDRRAWAQRLKASPARVQWDPERDLAHRPLSYRSVQVGLAGIAVEHYLDRWITGIRDVTEEARQLRRMIAAGESKPRRGLSPRDVPIRFLRPRPPSSARRPEADV
jgi:hypothetical protein